ncbi:hypothetical protein DSO57_1019365 [Entomophthora muscae]|uniref:Uncharacterized protein n=1 Tax=Entomophthora muscae TaxID=34485 RepID=A0ACC2U2J1_9FUNG|nr:hypothetical protein DSO57_1019365 [Entomophthora muscae]
MTCANQDGKGHTNLMGHRLELVNYPAACQLNKGDSPIIHQIAASLVPLMTQTYVKVVACLKEVKTRPDTGHVNEHQLLPASSLPDDGVNNRGGTKHCTFCLPELAQSEELNSRPDFEGCGGPAGPWAARLRFSRLAGGRAETSIGSNPINQGNLQVRLAANLQEQAGLLGALNQYGITPFIFDRLFKKGFAAQHNGPKSKGNSDDWLETQDTGPRDPLSCSDPKATPEDVRLMEQRLSQLRNSGGLLVPNDKNARGNMKV